MTAMLPRRALFALGTGAAVAGCGFQPVYMPTASGNPGPAERELAAVYITPTAERPGMLMRQALQDRFEGTGTDASRRYELTVVYWTAGTVLGVQSNSTYARVRVVGNASWALVARDPGHTKLISGTARATDALNALDSQVFAVDFEIEIIQKRLAEALADQITLQLAAYFRKRAAAES
jgi:LPS-assembly lipoprotein